MIDFPNTKTIEEQNHYRCTVFRNSKKETRNRSFKKHIDKECNQVQDEEEYYTRF